MKHGLTGRGIVIPDEDKAEVEARIDSFERVLKPQNEVTQFLARHSAVLSVRIERCARNEAAAITLEMLRAAENEAEDRIAEVEELMEELATDPRRAVRWLRRSPEGIDRLIESLEDLKVAPFYLSARRHPRCIFEDVERLGGRKPRSSTFDAMIDCPERRQLSNRDRDAIVHAEVMVMVDAELEILHQFRDKLDHDAIAREREGAAARAIFNPSYQATLARRYEATATRDFFKSLNAIEKFNEPSEEVAPSAMEKENCADLASSCESTSGSEPEPTQDSPASPDRPRFTPKPALESRISPPMPRPTSPEVVPTDPEPVDRELSGPVDFEKRQNPTD